MRKKINELVKNEKVGGCCCADKAQLQAEGSDRSVEGNDFPLHKLIVTGATCGGCASKIERTLQSVAGVEEAHMNLSAGVAVVSGDVTTESLIKALENVGFSASKAT
jgi:Cu+-exporting ATPase